MVGTRGASVNTSYEGLTNRGNRTLVYLDFEQEEANVLIFMVSMEPSQINGKHVARGRSREFRTTTHRLLTKKVRAHVIVKEHIQPRSTAERTKRLILAAVRVWEFEEGHSRASAGGLIVSGSGAGSAPRAQ